MKTNTNATVTVTLTWHQSTKIRHAIRTSDLTEKDRAELEHLVSLEPKDRGE